MTEDDGAGPDLPFIFNDDIFPSIESSFPSLPLAPSVKIEKFSRDYHIVSRIDGSEEKVHKLFRWAREVLDFAEAQPGLNKDLIDTAVDVVKLISDSAQSEQTSSSPTPSKFYGAANYTIGLWYLFGLFKHPVNSDIAMEKFLTAAKQGYSRALYRLGAFYESSGQISSALAYFEHGVRRKDASCYYRMAIGYLQGQLGKSIDTKVGLEYLERASFLADPDCAQAAYIYGLVQLGEVNIPSLSESHKPLDREAGILALERSAWLGFGPALLRMGKAWQGGEKGYDPSISLRYFHIASRQDQYTVYKEKLKRTDDSPIVVGPLLGVPEMEISKWMICGCEGKFPINEEWAFKFALMAANEGNSTGEFGVGYFYEVGVYVESDVDKALKYYKLAADHGFEDAKARLKVLQETKKATNAAAVTESDTAATVTVTIQRQLTRKDHERTISIKRMSSNPSRNNSVPSQSKPLPPTPSIHDLPQPSPRRDYDSYSPNYSPSVSRSPSPRRPFRSLTESDLPAPLPANNIHKPFNFTPSAAATGEFTRRSPSPRRAHRYSASVVTEQQTHNGPGSLESRMSPRKVSSPVRAPILEESNKASTDLEIAGPHSISRTPSPTKAAARTMSANERTPSPTKMSRTISNNERLNSIRNPMSLHEKRPSLSTSHSAPPPRSVSGHTASRLPSTPPNANQQDDNELLYRVVPLKVRKSSELLQRRSFANESQNNDASPDPKPSPSSTDPLKRTTTKLSPATSPAGLVLNPTPLHHPDTYSLQQSSPDQSESPSDVSTTSTPTTATTPTRPLRSSGSQPVLDRFSDLQLDDNSPPNIRHKGTISSLPERSVSRSPLGKSSSEKSRPTLSRPFSFFTLKSPTPKTPPRSSPPLPSGSSESITPPTSQFSRASTVSSTTTTSTEPSPPPRRVALTFEEMGIPVGTEEEKDCIIM